MDLLEFKIFNASSSTIEQVVLNVQGKVINEELEQRSSQPVPPNRSFLMRVPGFFPQYVGRDVLHISIQASFPSSRNFYLIGDVSVEVMPNDQILPSMNVNITSQGPLIVDMEDAFNLSDKQNNNYVPISEESWQEIQLFWDFDKQKREINLFPPAIIDSSVFSVSPEAHSMIKTIPPEKNPKAAISTESGEKYYLLFGNTILLGRTKECHVPAVLLPVDMYPDNEKVSRVHCEIRIEGNRAYIKDLSLNGTFLGKSKLPRHKSVAIANHDTIWIADVLELEVRLFTDGQQIIAIKINRLGNKREDCYILAQGPVPLGSKETLPIYFPGVPEIWGAIYYDPLSSHWYFLDPYSTFESKDSTPLLGFQELTYENKKIAFSIL